MSDDNCYTLADGSCIGENCMHESSQELNFALNQNGVTIPCTPRESEIWDYFNDFSGQAPIDRGALLLHNRFGEDWSDFLEWHVQQALPQGVVKL